MLEFILFIFLIYLCIKFIKLDAITKYFESILFLIIGMIPSCVGLLLFDHSLLSKSDILQTTGMWFWVSICLFYTVAFILLYTINLPLIHPLVWKYLKVNYIPSDDDWKPTILQMFIYSNYCRNYYLF